MVQQTQFKNISYSNNCVVGFSHITAAWHNQHVYRKDFSFRNDNGSFYHFNVIHCGFEGLSKSFKKQERPKLIFNLYLK